tara:strand:- start:458 stop:1462 length:1005 start_codon:yes stop_codon:yes gene_type:complete
MYKNNKSLTLQILKYSISITFLLGIIYYIFLKEDPKRLIDTILQADFYLVFLSMIFGLIALLNRGLRWTILIESLGYNSSKMNSVAAVSSGYLINMLLPRAGEVTRCTALNQSDGIPVDKLFGTVLLERVIDMIMVIFFFILSLILNFNDLSQFFLKIQIGNLHLSNNTYYLIIFSILMIYIIYRLIKKSKIYVKVIEFINGLKEGFISIKKIERKWEFWIHTISIWIMYFLMTYICFGAIEATSDLGFSDGIFLLVLGALAMIVPLPGMAGYMPSIIIGLSILGIGCDDCSDADNPAFVFTTILYASQTLVLIAMGVLGFIILFLSRKKARNG